MLVACTTELPADADSTPRSTDMSAGPRLDQGGVAEDAEVGAEDGAPEADLPPLVDAAPDAATPTDAAAPEDAALPPEDAELPPEDAALPAEDAALPPEDAELPPEDARVIDARVIDAEVELDVAVEDARPVPDLREIDQAVDAAPDEAVDVADPPDMPELCAPLACYASAQREGTVGCAEDPVAECGAQAWSTCDCNAGGSVHLMVEAALQRITLVAPPHVVEISLSVDGFCHAPRQVCPMQGACEGMRAWEWRFAASPGDHQLVVYTDDADTRCNADGLAVEEMRLQGSW